MSQMTNCSTALITHLTSTQSALHKLSQIIVTVLVTDLLLQVVQENQHFLLTTANQQHN